MDPVEEHEMDERFDRLERRERRRAWLADVALGFLVTLCVLGFAFGVLWFSGSW